MSTAPTSHAFAAARLAPILGAILQVLTPILPQLGIGEPIGDRSDDVQTLITPAGWAFSIWGPLYAGSALFALFQALPSQRNNEFLARIRWPAAGAFFGNAAWAAYTQSYDLTAISVLIILFTLVCLMIIYRHFVQARRSFSAGERWLAVLPLSALASWLTVASIVNIASSLRYHGVEAAEIAPLLGAGVIVVGGLIAAAILHGGRGNPFYALVFLWALAAIYAAGGQRASEIAIGAAVAALLVIGASLLGLGRGGNRYWFGSGEDRAATRKA